MLRGVSVSELIEFLSGLPGVVVVTAGPENGAPEVAWGDSFFLYDPDDDLPPERQLPFATIVTKNYPGFDTASDLDRPGVFRLNIAVGRTAFEEIVGHPPEVKADGVDHTALDRLLPHPVYATQGWVCVLNPGAAAGEQVRSALVAAHARAAARHRPSH
jgi:hypothetical protein